MGGPAPASRLWCAVEEDPQRARECQWHLHGRDVTGCSPTLFSRAHGCPRLRKRQGIIRTSRFSLAACAVRVILGGRVDGVLWWCPSSCMLNTVGVYWRGLSVDELAPETQDAGFFSALRLSLSPEFRPQDDGHHVTPCTANAQVAPRYPRKGRRADAPSWPGLSSPHRCPIGTRIPVHRP